MSALDWHKKLPQPALGHSEGMVVVVIAGRTMLFPSEAAARFFFEAYAELPALVAENATLRSEIDEGALHAANARVAALEAEVAKLTEEKAMLEQLNAFEVQKRTDAVRRATVLAKAVRQIREKL